VRLYVLLFLKEVSRTNTHPFSAHPKDPTVRAFLLTNLINDGPGTPLRWRIPHFMIEESAIEEIAKFPHTKESRAVYKGDTLFLKGTKSR